MEQLVFCALTEISSVLKPLVEIEVFEIIELGLIHSSLFGTESIDVGVGEDPKKPGSEIGPCGKTRIGAERSEVRLLHEILGVSLIAGESACCGEQRRHERLRICNEARLISHPKNLPGSVAHRHFPSRPLTRADRISASARIAQSAERLTRNEKVASSILAPGSTHSPSARHQAVVSWKHAVHDRFVASSPVSDLTFLLRVWLPDRPGVLGAVATRLGAVKGDLLGIEIIERGGGVVIDELLIRLPSIDLVDLMLKEVGLVEGVSVEDLRPIEEPFNPDVDALEAATAIVQQAGDPTLSAGERADVVCRAVHKALRCTWVAMMGTDGLLATCGSPPAESWLSAYSAGSLDALNLTEVADASEMPLDEGSDSIVVRLPNAGLSLVLGRENLAFRHNDRRRVAAIARLTDALPVLAQLPSEA